MLFSRDDMYARTWYVREKKSLFPRLDQPKAEEAEPREQQPPSVSCAEGAAMIAASVDSGKRGESVSEMVTLMSATHRNTHMTDK